MRRARGLLFLFACLAFIGLAQAGEVYLETFRSQAIGRDYKYTIYLPDDYKQGSRRYPVLYLLHGAGGDENEWLYKGGARETLDAMIARHAAANGLPVELVHRVVKRESGYNPRASHAGNIGLMQIRYATARGIGYSGSASGLLDPETNLTYAVRYLAGAYRAAGGNASRAVSLYASGYHGRSVRRVAVARRAPAPADAMGWQRAPVLMRSDSARGMI